MKGGTSHNSAVVANVSQGGNAAHPAKIQPTAEQIRYAKLAQLPGLDENKIQEKIQEVSEVTGRTLDVVAVALHESNYEVSIAIQNILDGQYECLDTEWQTKPSKKKKTIAAVPSGIEKGENEEEVAENHVNEDDDEKMVGKPQKSMHGGRRGGRIKRFEQKSDEKAAGDDKERGNEFSNEQGFDRTRSLDRGRGRARGRGRGGMQRGAGGSRRGGFGGGRGGGAFSGPGRGGSKARGRGGGFARKPRLDKDNQNNLQNDPSDETSSAGPIPDNETWDNDGVVEKPSTEPVLNWADATEAEEKAGDWSQDQWITPVAEDNTASLFANSIMASSAQTDSWNHVNGPDKNWNRASPNHQQEESLYRPENVDAAVIMSQRAQTASDSESYQNANDRPVYTSSLHNSQFPSSHQDTSLTSSLLGRAYNIEDLAKSFKLKNHVSDVTTSSHSATMISGVHDSHKLEQEQLQPSKTQRQPKTKRTQKSQIPSQPVEMPKSVMEDLEHQLGGLEFGSGPMVSPKFGSDSKPSFVPASSVTTAVFQQSTPANLASTIHHETSRHSVAIAEDTSQLTNVSSLPASIASKNERPKTPPGLSSLQEHQSPARHFVPSSPRDMNRIAQVPNQIPFPSNARPSSQSLTSASTLNPTSDSLAGSYSSARNAMQNIASVQEGNVIIGNDQRANQAMIGLSEIPMNSHIQQQVSSSYATVNDAFGSTNISSNTSVLAQPMTTASFTKPSIAPPPGVLPSTAHVTYSSSTLASQVLGFSSAPNTTAAQAALKAQPNTGKLPVSGPPGMLPVNVYPGMQQGMIPTGYPTYSYEDIQMLQRMPMHSYYDVMYPPAGANRESLGSNFQAGDNKFARDASPPVASTMNTGNPHAAHAQQQAAMYGAAAATPMPYGYAYYGMIPGNFPVYTTAAVYHQVPTGKGHMGGTHYQAAYNTQQHSSHAFNTAAGASQDFEKGPYLRTATQALQHSKNGQAAGTLTAGSASTENVHHTGFKSQQFNQDSKGYQLTATPPSMSIPLPHGQSHMTSYTPYMMPHHASMMHQTAGHISHQQLDSSNQGSLVGRTQQQQQHSMATPQQPKREVKGQGYGASYWPGTN